MRGRLEPGQDDHDGFPGSPPWGPCPGRAAPPRRSQPGMGDAPDARRRLRRLVLMILGLDAAVDRPGCPQGDQATAPAPCWRTAMTPPSKSRWDRPAHYQIVVRGELSDRFAHAFPEMTLQPEAGYTRITGVIVDQSHLHGILEGLRSFGIELVSVNEVVESSSPTEPKPGPSHRITTLFTDVPCRRCVRVAAGERRRISAMRPHSFGVDIEPLAAPRDQGPGPMAASPCRRTSASAWQRRRAELREDRRPSGAQNAGGEYAQAQPCKPDEGQQV